MTADNFVFPEGKFAAVSGFSMMIKAICESQWIDRASETDFGEGRKD